MKLADREISIQAIQALITLAKAISKPSWMAEAEGKSASMELRRDELRKHIVKLKWEARIALGLCDRDNLENTPADKDDSEPASHY